MKKRRKGKDSTGPTEKSIDHVLSGRVGGLMLHAKGDSRQITQKARNAFARRFEDQVDPTRELPELERLRRAEAAKRAHMTRLALRSAQARRARRADDSQH